MNHRKWGLSLLNVSGVLIIAGAFYDLFVPNVPPNHAAWLGVSPELLDPQVAELDLAMLRSIGGCLLAIGITSLILTNGPVRRGERWAAVTLFLLVAIAEGNNSYRMYRFGSPWYGPLSVVVLTAIGVVFVCRISSRNAQGTDKTSESEEP